MPTLEKILFICPSDYGQANVVLATVYALLAADVHIEIHIASEHSMKKEVEHTKALSDETLRGSAPHHIHFHGMDGPSYFEALTRPGTGIVEAWKLPLPDFRNTASFLSRFSLAAMPWEPEELVDMYAQTVSIIEKVKPDLAVVDTLHLPGLTAAYQLQIKWTVLAPNTIKDFAVPSQPRGAALWKYPILGSALPYPVPWSKVAHNVCLTLLLAKAALTDGRRKTAARLLRQHAGDENLQMLSIAELGVVQEPPPGLRVIIAFSEDLDYPFKLIPDHITPVGPIVRYAQKLADVDSSLDAWLSRGPTIYANLGTQFSMTPSQALQMSLALRDLLDAAGASSKLQVLWKLKRKPEAEDSKADGSSGSEDNKLPWSEEWEPVREALSSMIRTDRVRIVSWVQADPCSILQSGHIACSVHHGGANSHHEALVAGVPQVILPAWIDCYDFGNRVELSGVGVRANKTVATRWQRGEIGNALRDVLLGPKAAAFRERAREVAEKHHEAAGRTKAASVILEVLNSG